MTRPDSPSKPATVLPMADAVSITGSDVDIAEARHAAPRPTLVHSLKHDRSILSIALSSNTVYAGTEEGEILVFSLNTYQKFATIDAHRGSVLGLSLSQDEKLLFSCASDRFVNVWDTQTLRQVYSIYPHKDHDVGDIYAVSYASKTNTIYIGTQNASILWYDLDHKDENSYHPKLHPYQREDRFFDSAGPGGIRTPRPEFHEEYLQAHQDVQVLQIDEGNIQPFAHYGYVYCMLLLHGIYGDCEAQETLVTGGGDGTIKLWALSKSESGAPTEFAQLGDVSGDSVLSLVLDGSILISGTIQGRVKVWDLETRQMLRNLKANVDDVLALSVGQGCLFVAGANGKVETYDRQFERLNSYTAHHARILASGFAIHNEEPVYLTGANDSSINLWDVHDCIASQPPKINATSNEKLLDRLRVFVSHKTVSSDERCRMDCRRGASFLRSLFRELGATAEMLPLENPNWNPIVFATFKANAPQTTKQRILFYAHYDVVRAVESNWHTNPFSMEGINEHLYGRGITDNKGPLLAAVYAVADMLAAKELQVDIVFLVEGEEECGSRGFAQAVQKHKARIGQIDWILLANSYWLDDEVPCLTYGLRGVIHASVEVSSSNPDLHSGVDGNSRGDESMKDLIAVLNALVGRRGHVNIPNFYESAPELNEEEKEHYRRVSCSMVSRNPKLGSEELVTKQLQQKWREPSLTVHGIDTSGPFNSTIIPRLAKASISLRLVPHQEAKKVAEDLVAFLQEEFDDLESTNRLRVTIDHKADPWLGDLHNELYQTLEQGIIQAWPEKFSTLPHAGIAASPKQTTGIKGLKNGSKCTLTKPLYIREGGSIPAIRFLEKEFEAAAAHLPCGQATDNAHLDNERFRLINLYRSRDVFKFVFRELPQRSV